MPRAYPNARKTNKFQVFLEGLNVALVNDVKMPDEEITVDRHAAPGDVTDLPTPTGRKWSDLVLKQVFPADAPFDFWDNWMNNLVDQDGRFGDLESGARVITLVELGIEDMPLEEHSYLVFPTKTTQPEFKGGSDGKTSIKEITLTVIRRM